MAPRDIFFFNLAFLQAPFRSFSWPENKYETETHIGV